MAVVIKLIITDYPFGFFETTVIIFGAETKNHAIAWFQI